MSNTKEPKMAALQQTLTVTVDNEQLNQIIRPLVEGFNDLRRRVELLEQKNLADLEREFDLSIGNLENE